MKNQLSIITKINNKYYDLTNFTHPGGKIPMLLINNKDGTTLFESYHPVSDRNMLNKILLKYEVNNVNINSKSPYDFNKFSNNILVIELREEVYKYFKNIADNNNCSLISATKMSNNKIYENILIFVLLLINIYYLYNKYIFALFTTSFIHFLFIINNWHDAGHFAMITNKKIELLIMPILSALHPTFSWYTGHTRDHHSYTNIVGLDPDINEYIIKPKKENILTTIIKIPFVILIK